MSSRATQSGLREANRICWPGVLTAGDAATKGLGISEKIFSDDDPDDIEKSIPPTAIHRNVDLAIVQADKEGKLQAKFAR